MIYSRQREIILNTLRTNPVHPTTDELHEMVKGQDPNISIAPCIATLISLRPRARCSKFPIRTGRTGSMATLCIITTPYAHTAAECSI